MANYHTPTKNQENIFHTISHALKIAPQRLYPGTHLRDNLHLDSVDTTLLIATLESRFDVYLSPEQVATIETVDDIARCFGR
ncbi:MAG: acyl carrier protein [Lewinella sp.]|nr:acyl carrier protein [Lewinella sp.]